ncbi:MAG: Glutaredoxin [Chloroflexi bacterium]|nr:Glutaredoxin [Chloroflexota bacterium]
MAAAAPITVYVRPGDPDSEAVVAHLRSRGHRFTTRDVHSDPSASAVLFGRLGRVAVPAVQVGERMVVGYDPVQLARLLPSQQAEEPPVSFGAAVRSVSPDLARERGLPAAWGVEVGRVTPGTPAAEAGIRPGDVITGVGAYTLAGGADQFRAAVAARRPGDTMTLSVRRDGEDVVLPVTFPRTGAEDGAPAG